MRFADGKTIREALTKNTPAVIEEAKLIAAQKTKLKPADAISRLQATADKAVFDDNYLATIRVNASMTRAPDRYSDRKNAALRAEHARVFGLCIGGQEQKEGWLYLTLPFQASLLTDPVLYAVPGGLLVLDHPTRRGASEFAFDIFGKRAHVNDLPRHWSLYANRHPRIITCPRKREEIQLSYMLNRLSALGFFGPFAKEAA